MKSRIFVVLIAAVLAACGRAQIKAPKSLACVPTPQWYIADKDGKPASAVFVCFGDQGELLYNGRALTEEEKLKLAQEKQQAVVNTPAQSKEQKFIEDGRKTVAKMKKFTEAGIKKAQAAKQ